MERQDYPAILPQLSPPQAVDILNERVQQVGRLNSAIADWLLERRRLEAQYSAGLRKLAQRHLDGVDLGVFSVPWTTLTGSADALADSHAALAVKIESDVEQPLRKFVSTNREMSQISTVQGNLAALAKDVERATQKTEKLRDKGDKAEPGKVATANSELDTAQQQWETQAPYVFENLQSLDETRLNHLREALTQFQTHEVDQVERDRTTAEQCLSVLLGVETGDEIKSFAQRAPQLRPSLPASRSQRNSVATPSRAFQPPAASASPSALLPATSQEDDYGVPSSGPADEKHKGRLKGLRRLGTVMSRKRESRIPPGALPPTSESPERKQRPSPFSSFSGRMGRSRENAPTLGSLQENSPRERPRSPLRHGSEIFQPSPDARQITTPIPDSTLSEPEPQVNGTSSAAPVAAIAAGATAAVAGTATLAMLNGSHQNDLADLLPPKPVEPPIQTPPATTETLKDSEGFSVPPQNLDPISQAQADAAAFGEGSAQPFSVNIKDAPIQDDGQNREASLADAANKLQAPPPSSTRRAGTLRGRRDNRNSTINSTYAPPEQSISESEAAPLASAAAEKDIAAVPPIQTSASAVQPPATLTSAGLTQSPSSNAFGQVAASTFSPFTPQVEQQVPSPLRPDSRAATGLDSQSIRSSTTTGSQGAARHPELQETGLNSSIIETVTAKFDNGKLTSSSMIGEIALAYNPANFSSPFGTENIRLENFSGLEKVAPNPAFINQLTDTSGEYSVNLSTLGKTQIAFKYQVRLDDAGSQAPLLIAPAFRPEATQFSVIISYSLNPAFALRGEESVTLSNVTLALTLEGAKATNCLSKPVGTFSRERNLIYWQLGDLVLKPGVAPEKLLARFATESQASSGSVEARWEIGGEAALKLGSGLSVSMPGQSGAADPFADESAHIASWKPAPCVKKIVSGSYGAK